MECPKCGYERSPEDTHCPLCQADFAYLDKLEAEKKALKQQKEQPADFQAAAAEPVASKPKPAPAKKAPEKKSTEGSCPKCGYDRPTGAVECSRCGLIYDKHEEAIATRQAEEEARKKAEAERVAAEKARIQKEAEKGIAKQKARKQTKEKVKAVAKEKAGKAKTIAAQKVKSNKKLLIISAIVIVSVIIAGVVGYSQFQIITQNMLEKKQKAAHEEMLRKQAEEHKKIAADFESHTDTVFNRIKTLISDDKLDAAMVEINKYDVPPLADNKYLTWLKRYYKERELFLEARNTPQSDVEKNYSLYSRLAQMNPNSAVYKTKLKYFAPKMAETKYLEAKSYFNKKERYTSDLVAAIDAIDDAVKLGGNKSKYQDVKDKLVKARLQIYEGNDNIKMAVRDDGIIKKGTLGGQRKLFVGIRNTGSDSYFINLDYFTLVTKSDRLYKYNDCSRELVRNIKPGEEAQGFIYFYTTEKPKKLIFSHVRAGEIERVFP